jgi:hypothetical protein
MSFGLRCGFFAYAPDASSTAGSFLGRAINSNLHSACSRSYLDSISLLPSLLFRLPPVRRDTTCKLLTSYQNPSFAIDRFQSKLCGAFPRLEMHQQRFPPSSNVHTKESLLDVVRLPLCDLIRNLYLLFFSFLACNRCNFRRFSGFFRTYKTSKIWTPRFVDEYGS